jgi:hypothetical protein
MEAGTLETTYLEWERVQDKSIRLNIFQCARHTLLKQTTASLDYTQTKKQPLLTTENHLQPKQMVS